MIVAALKIFSSGLAACQSVKLTTASLIVIFLPSACVAGLRLKCMELIPHFSPNLTLC
jgi:hypothetical protein